MNQKQTKTPVSLQKFIGKLRRRKITDKELSLEPADQQNTSLNPSKSFTTVKLEHSADLKIQDVKKNPDLRRNITLHYTRNDDTASGPISETTSVADDFKPNYVG